MRSWPAIDRSRSKANMTHHAHGIRVAIPASEGDSRAMAMVASPMVSNPMEPRSIALESRLTPSDPDPVGMRIVNSKQRMAAPIQSTGSDTLDWSLRMSHAVKQPNAIAWMV